MESLVLFDGWGSALRVVISASLTYAAIVTALRVAGSTALAKMSAYDLVITIALGSIVATIPLSADVSLADGVAVLGTYLVLQAVMREAVRHVPRVSRLIKAPPTIVLWDGAVLHDRLKRVDVPLTEVHAAVRKAAYGSLGAVQAVVLENDGQWSVVPRANAHDLSAFTGLDVPS